MSDLWSEIGDEIILGSDFFSMIIQPIFLAINTKFVFETGQLIISGV